VLHLQRNANVPLDSLIDQRPLVKSFFPLSVFHMIIHLSNFDVKISHLIFLTHDKSYLKI